MSRILLLALFITGGLHAQTLHRPVAAVYTGLGAYSTGHADVLSFTANQASLAQIKNSAVALYGERKFLLSELNSYTALVGIPSGPGCFGLKANYTGFTAYNETQLGLAYARKLGKKMDAGAQFNYNGISISSGYGNASALSFELGTVMHVSEKLHAGIHVNNPVGGKFGKNGEKLSSVYTFGLGYEASEKFFVSTEIVKEEDRPVNINAGMQYKFIPRLLARAGISSAASSAWLGLGLTVRSFRLDISTNYHPRLGFTPGLLLLFELNRNKK